MKKAFTLIELLAVIVILGVILVIAVPKIVDTIQKSKQGVFLNSAKLIASSVEKKLEENKVLEIENSLTCESVVNLSEKDYFKCELSIVNDIAYITLVGKGKFENMSICNKNKDNMIISGACSIILTIDLDDGTMDNEPNESQNIGSKISLENPNKTNYTFIRWDIVEGNSIFNKDGKLEIGTKNTKIKAIWKEKTQLTINLDGGDFVSNQSGYYAENTSLNLVDPIKSKYNFIRWEITSGDATLNNKSLTIKTEPTEIKAIWEKDYVTYSELIADYRCGRTSVGSAPFIIDYNQSCTIEKENTNDWVIRLKYNGILETNDLSNIDIFLVGGGGGASGGQYSAINFEWGYYSLGSGGGGGYTSMYSNVPIEPIAVFEIKIGAGGSGCSGYCAATAGGETSLKETTIISGELNYTAAGGGGANRNQGGAGGHGGSAGNVTDRTGYNWQGGTTGVSQEGDTYEFNDSTKKQYSIGGIGGSAVLSSEEANSGNGGDTYHYFNANGYLTAGYSGATGIIAIRNTRT